MASNDPRGSSDPREAATDVFAVVSRVVPSDPSLRRRVPPAKARHLAADICAVVCGLRPACMIDYAPKIDAGVARAVLETLRADPRSGRHREVRALGVLLVEDVVLIADLDRVMRVFDDIGATDAYVLAARSCLSGLRLLDDDKGRAGYTGRQSVRENQMAPLDL